VEEGGVQERATHYPPHDIRRAEGEFKKSEKNSGKNPNSYLSGWRKMLYAREKPHKKKKRRLTIPKYSTWLEGGTARERRTVPGGSTKITRGQQIPLEGSISTRQGKAVTTERERTGWAGGIEHLVPCSEEIDSKEQRYSLLRTATCR